MGTIPRPLAARFWEKVDIREAGQCWPWIAGLTSTGYGQFGPGRGAKPIGAHRMAYILTVGPVTPEERVRHSCDNPICVNPDHLLKGTQADNVRDMDDRGRGRRAPRGTANWNARLDPDRVREIRTMLARGEALASIGRRYGVSTVAISRIRDGVTWSWVQQNATQ